MLSYLKFLDPSNSGLSSFKYAIYDTDEIDSFTVEKIAIGHYENMRVTIVTEYEFKKTFSKMFKVIEELEETKNILGIADYLLSEAHELMSNTHCYDTEIYHDINIYFEGEYEHVGEGSSYVNKEEEEEED